MGVDCVRKSKEIIHLFDKIANEQGCYFFDPSKQAICSDDDYMYLDEKAPDLQVFFYEINQKL